MTRDDQNIGSWLRHHANRDGDKAAILFEREAPLTYGELSQWIDATAAELSDKYHVTRGERVCYLGLNDPGMVVLMFACARLGAIFVPINWRLAPAEAAYIVTDCTPRVVFYGADFVETAEKSAEENGLPAEPCEKIQGWRPVDPQAGCDISPLAPDLERGRIDDPLLIVYTSGTTGRPKGAVLSQRAIFVNALNGVDMHELRRSDTTLVLLPLFHVGGLNILLTPALYVGATVCFQARFDPDSAYAAIR
ncbi:MAG: AMP-binding protein, partial [Fimbriimonadaceae bacterium]|nr:AMP-binding protein [Alphaproteobacteria bacterium]